MKMFLNLGIILLLGTITTVNAQSYHFNKLVIYKFPNGVERPTYFSTNKDAYFLRIQEINNLIIANLYDFVNKKNHEFEVIEDQNTKNYKFVYNKTVPLKVLTEKEKANFHVEFSTLSETDYIKKVNLKVFKNKGTKNEKLHLIKELEIKKGNENLFQAFRITSLHPLEFDNTITYPEKGEVVSFKELLGDFKGFEGIATINLKTLETVNFVINVKEN